MCGNGIVEEGEQCDPLDPEFPDGELDSCCHPEFCTRRGDGTECSIANVEEKLPFEACEIEARFGACVAGRCLPRVREREETCRAPGVQGPCDTGGKCNGVTGACPDATGLAACEDTELEEASVKAIKATCRQDEEAAQSDDADSLCEVEGEIIEPGSGAGSAGLETGEVVADATKKMRSRRSLLVRLRKMRVGLNTSGKRALKNPTGCVQLRAKVRIRQSSVSLVRDKDVVVCKSKRTLKAWQAAH